MASLATPRAARESFQGSRRPAALCAVGSRALLLVLVIRVLWGRCNAGMTRCLDNLTWIGPIWTQKGAYQVVVKLRRQQGFSSLVGHRLERDLRFL